MTLSRVINFLRVLWNKVSILEKVIILLLLLFVFLELTNISQMFYRGDYQIIPVEGGVITEGVLGRPNLINPVFARSETDKTLSSLIFSGLVSYNEDREIVPCLAEKWEVSEDKKDYKFYLREDLKWHDGYPFNAEDVNYTIAVLQNPDYYESLKYVWEGIVVEKNDEHTISFHLSKPYPFFLENLTIGILPHHLWVDIPVKDFKRSTLNINAVGLGPYKIKELLKDSRGKISSLVMEANDNFAIDDPLIKDFEIKFFDEKTELLEGFNSREFSSFGMYSSEDPLISKKKRGYDNYSVNIPQYVALFFNQERSTSLSDRAVRQALAYSLNKEAINNKATFGAGVIINSPILPNYLGYNSEIKKYDHDIVGANTILSQAGWIDQDNDDIREKEENELSFDLVVPDEGQFIRVAEELSDQWEEIGVKLNVIKSEGGDLEENYISNRDYDILLIGENLGSDPDPYSYWHSSQKEYPGLNLSLYENGEVDKLLEEARQSNDSNLRIKNYKKFQEIIADEIPSIFLYQPVYIYKIYDKVKEIDLSNITNTWDRFYNIYNWFVKFERVKDAN